MDWLSLPSLSSLRAFAAVAERQSFSAAGAALNVSHAAVSQQVRGLEERLGTELVVREGRGIALTAAGHDLARELDAAFGQIAKAVDALVGGDAARPLQVTLTPVFAMNWLMPRLTGFSARHPEVEIMLNPTATVVPLGPGGVDVAIRFGQGNWPGVQAEMLVPTDIAVVAARSLIGDRRITDPAELMDYPWLQELGTNEVTVWLQRQGVIPTKRLSLTHVPGYLAMEGVRNGQGVSAAARVWVEEDLAAGRVQVLFEDRRPDYGYYVVTRPGPMRPPLKAFVSWLRKQAAATDGESASDLPETSARS